MGKEIDGQTKASVAQVQQSFMNAMHLTKEEFEDKNDFENLINCLTEKNQLERFMYRKEIANNMGTKGGKSFANVKDLKGQVSSSGETIK